MLLLHSHRVNRFYNGSQSKGYMLLDCIMVNNQKDLCR